MSAAMAAVATFNAHAGFFIPKDTTMVMGMISPTESMTEIAYGVTRDTSVAFGVSTMTNAARSYRWQMVHAQATKLMGRLFSEDGIGNAYVFAGPLAARAVAWLQELRVRMECDRRAGDGSALSGRL